MEKKLWFRAKSYGWGWYPSSWQGWVLLVAYLFVVLKSTWRFTASGLLEQDIVQFLLRVGLPTGLLIVICFLKGERPRWRWGRVDETTSPQ